MPSTTSCRPFLVNGSSISSRSRLERQQAVAAGLLGEADELVDRALRSVLGAANAFLYSAGIFFIASMPHAAIVAPNVPHEHDDHRGHVEERRREVPSIMAATRMPTNATTMPIAVAAFIAPGHRLGAADLSPVQRGIGRPCARGSTRSAPEGAGALEGPLGGEAGRNC